MSATTTLPGTSAALAGVGGPANQAGMSGLAGVGGPANLAGLGQSQLSAVGIPTAASSMNPNDIYAMALGNQMLANPGALASLFQQQQLQQQANLTPPPSGGGEGGGSGGGETGGGGGGGGETGGGGGSAGQG